MLLTYQFFYYMNQNQSLSSASSPVQTKLSINELQSNPFQPRDSIKNEDLQELVQSIRAHGVIEPLVVAQTPAGYQLIAGERRWRAAKLAGLTEVPVTIMKTTPKVMLELALVENVQREDLNSIERATGFQQLIREFNMTVGEISQRIGKSSSYVSNSIRLLTLPDIIKDAVIRGDISEGHARALVSLESEATQIQCYHQMILEKSSVRGAEEIVRRQREQEKKVPFYLQAPPLEQKKEQVVRIQKQIGLDCRVPVVMNIHRSSAQSRLTITLKGNQRQTNKDLDLILSKLGSSLK